MTENVWNGMSEYSEKFLLNKVSPNPKVLEAVLSLDADRLDTIDSSLIRKYMVVLAQYFISLQFEENVLTAVGNAWKNALESRIFTVLRRDPMANVKTLSEKRGLVLEQDSEAAHLDEQFQIVEAKKTIIHGMSKPVEQYINVLKKELEARDNEAHRG